MVTSVRNKSPKDPISENGMVVMTMTENFTDSVAGAGGRAY